jgi:uncharacterized protein
MKLIEKWLCLFYLSMAFSAPAIAQSHYPGQHAGKLKIAESIPIKAYAFDLQDVKLSDSQFKENMERESKWILSIGVNSLLHSFRTNAGVYFLFFHIISPGRNNN